MRHVAIPILLLCHVVAAILSTYLSTNRPSLATAIFFGIIFCQTSLLGMWVGLGMTHWLLRLISLACGTAILSVTCALGIESWSGEIVVVIATPSVLVAVVTRFVRLWKGAMVRIADAKPLERRQEALQFSIRHLMILTFVVACLTTIGKVLAPTIRQIDVINQVAALGVCYAAVALTSVWAVLGSGRPIVRSPVVFVIGLLSGIVGAYLVDGPAENWFWISTTVLQAILLLVSLSLVRAVGYRFVAMSAIRSFAVDAGKLQGGEQGDL